MSIQNFLFLALIILSVNAIGQETADTLKWLTYERDKYTVDYPPDWELSALGGRFYSFTLYSPQESEEDYIEMIELQSETLDHLGENANLKGAVKVIEDKRKFFCRYEKEEWVTRNGHPCYETVYTHNLASSETKVREYKWVKDKRLYMLSYNSHTDTYDKYSAIAYRIMDSFRLK